MPCRTTCLAIAAILLAPGAVRAQVRAPTPVGEEEEVARQPAAPVPGRPAAPLAPPAAAPPQAAPAAAGEVVAPPQQPGPPPPSERLAARPIELVAARHADLEVAWAERREALREQDLARAAAAGERLLAVKRQLAIQNMLPHAAAEVREASRSLQANAPADALAHAEMAVALAPDFADGYLTVARAHLAADPGSPLPVLTAFWEAVRAAAREPRTQRAFLGDVASALLAALFTTAVITAGLLLLRVLRLVLHDVHHLPLLRGTAPVQTGLLTLVVLAAPLALGLGPVVVVGVALAAAWLYLSAGQRLAGSACLLILAGLPLATREAARATAWTGTLAETVAELEQGALPDRAVDALAERAATGRPPVALATALGRHYKRRGQLDAALRWYDEALATDERAAEVVVDRANVLFLQGRDEEAKAAYLAAGDRSGGDLTVQAAAHYGLSKLYLRHSDMEKASAARDRAEQEDGPFLRQHGSDDDFSANRYLVDVPVPAGRIRALAAADGAADALAGAVRQRLTGALPRGAWPWAPLGLVAALWLVGLLARRLEPSHACQRCGRAACRRCDAAGGPLCGQCVNVYVKKGMVDPRDRLRKEAQVRRHRQVQVVVTRILGVVAGGAGHLWHGLAGRGMAALVALLFVGFVIWFWRGVTPPPQPSPYVLVGKLAVAVPLGLLVYALTLRDLLRQTGGRG